MSPHRELAVVLVALASFAASPAGAVSMAVQISLRLEIVAIAPPAFTSIGSVTLNGSGPGGHLDSLTLASNQVGGTQVIAVTDPASAPITGLRTTVANRAGSLAETVGGALRGSIGLQGVSKVCLFGDGGCANAIANIGVPLTVIGDGGSQFVTAAVNLTVFGAPWTTGQAAIGTITRMGSALGPASQASSTALASGSLQLVTPVHIVTNISASVVVPIWGVMTMHFVPEPTTLLLLGGGVVALAAAGRSRLP